MGKTTLQPRTFEDKEGRVWDVSLDMAGALRIDASDFSELTDKEFSILRPEGEFFSRVLTDPPIICGMIWAIIQPQVKEKLGIDPREPADPEKGLESGEDRAREAFLQGLDGDSMENARTAFWGAVSDFFPKQRTGLLALIEQWEKAQEKVAQEVQGMRGEIQEILDQEIEMGLEDLRSGLKELSERRNGEKSGQ